jgi:hypothetical protein
VPRLWCRLQLRGECRATGGVRVRRWIRVYIDYDSRMRGYNCDVLDERLRRGPDVCGRICAAGCVHLQPRLR